jgi:hypothetical protein
MFITKTQKVLSFRTDHNFYSYLQLLMTDKG